MTMAYVTSIIITTLNGDLQPFRDICNTSVILNALSAKSHPSLSFCRFFIYCSYSIPDECYRGVTVALTLYYIFCLRVLQSTSTAYFSYSSKYRRTSLRKTYHRVFDFANQKARVRSNFRDKHLIQYFSRCDVLASTSHS